MTSKQSASHWRPLFNGRDTQGWKMVGPGQFTVENDAMVTRGGMGLLWFAGEKFGNCQFRVVFRLSTSNDNSGIFVRIPDAPQSPWDAVHGGYEVQIENNGDEWHRTGCLYSLTKAIQNVSAKPGEWTTVLITLQGKRTMVEVNGTLVTDYMEGQPVPPKKQWYEPDRGPRPLRGYFGLQNHDEHTRVHFREVSVRSL